MMRHKNARGDDEFKVKLIDFGLAKQLDREGRVRTGFVGTVGFMAPEVANAQYKQDYASPASDLFSVGVGWPPHHLLCKLGDSLHAGLWWQGTLLGRQ